MVPLTRKFHSSLAFIVLERVVQDKGGGANQQSHPAVNIAHYNNDWKDVPLVQQWHECPQSDHPLSDFQAQFTMQNPYAVLLTDEETHSWIYRRS